VDNDVIETALWVLRREEAWPRLASYLAFNLVLSVAIAAIEA
jgi:hypothetical protein